ncbi:MAG TPA: acetyl-CoA carboxylase biotin carboxylase subunit [Bryobacteraceae bacterium]|nr:acetyl-CoA carboxylase biotin carboxylase subunit [Bryobacteraceae bacterium]
MFRKVLVANRGEIAVRIVRGLHELRIPALAVYSDADRDALHVRMAEEAAYIGAAPSTESYLRIDRIIEAAHRHGADAVHPGYGFLSENAEFAAACEEEGLVFIGPSAQSIKRLGSKTAARQLAKAAGVPVVPGTEDATREAEEARRIAAELGYPVLLKAAAGGGGKGMRRVDSEDELESAIRDASSEAERAFGSGEVYIEKLIVDPRHIEIQLIGDRHGNLVHLGERECSIQRRHQKVIEECPSPLSATRPELRSAMGEAAVAVAREAGYFNAGTAEFIVDRDGKFYFLEMNTRLQVEHGVTELVTGVDLLHLQVLVAAGGTLPLRQTEIQWRGAAIECRVCAEDPEAGFLPTGGRVAQLSEPGGPGVRVDSGLYAGFEVPFEYDPMLSKMMVWAGDRATAIARCRRALEEYAITGVKTNLGFLRHIMDDPEFIAGRLHTGFIPGFLERRPREAPCPELEDMAALIAAAHVRARNTNGNGAGAQRQGSVSRWLANGRAGVLR